MFSVYCENKCILSCVFVCVRGEFSPKISSSIFFLFWPRRPDFGESYSTKDEILLLSSTVSRKLSTTTTQPSSPPLYRPVESSECVAPVKVHRQHYHPKRHPCDSTERYQIYDDYSNDFHQQLGEDSEVNGSKVSGVDWLVILYLNWSDFLACGFMNNEQQVSIKLYEKLE